MQPSWETVQTIARALGVSCEAFAEPASTDSKPPAALPRGRPRKAAGSPPAADIVVDMIIQNASEGGLTDISFTVSRSDAHQALELARQSLADLGAEEATLQTHIAKVSIVGAGMQSHAGVAARMFEALAAEMINILMISTSEIKISCVIEDKYTELAVRVLHDAFQLDREER